MSAPKTYTIAEVGFREIANRVAVLRDDLHAAGAPQEIMARVDRLLFTAQVGENLAAEKSASEEKAGATVGALSA